MEADDGVRPPAAFRERANLRTDPRGRFADGWPGAWDEAGDLLDWFDPYDAVLAGEGEEPPFDWFAGGRLNASHECLDRHVAERKNHLALRWEGHHGETRSYTYLDLYREVNAFAAGLRELGVAEDDVVTLYMPVVPELVVAMLACARLGAPHSVVFAGFSADALAARMERADSRYLVTCDGYYRRGDAINQKRRADNARLAVDHDLTATVVVDRLDGDRTDGGRRGDGHRSYDALVAAHEGSELAPVAREAGDVLFLSYTSGTTGEPKSVAHTTGGYLAHVAWTARNVLDIKPSDTYWCSADIGWITGHSYIVYGPLALGTTTTLYEGTADHPEKDRIFSIIERNAVDVFYTAPTAIRSFMKWGPEYPANHDLSSLRLLGTVGKPIDERAWRWYYEHVGGGDCPVVDTWWQTETGAILVSTLPGVDAMKPGSAGPPLPGIDAAVVDSDGTERPPGEAGLLAIRSPWPGMPRELAAATDWGADAAAGDDWWYLAGDEAVVDDDGYVRVIGRADDALHVGGRRVGTGEIERAVVGVEGVAETAVVGVDRPAGDTAVHAYVTPEARRADDDRLREAVVGAVEDAIGPMVAPERVVFTPRLPKTRSGKIMRRLLEDIANGEEYGDISALRNPEVVGELESGGAGSDGGDVSDR
ncbi:acetate--CoA ligase [Candidatus Halobonum tyrrellensis]|uniref:acetate--CoA ligase n=1 Tax=Candidatus Halobonum tyrrellensis G22 TaxID=1324957 RepID=V4HAG9_9EURY|nr:acetate--CoA ligase [Candidatus Halobonum tyrrellensis]ESP87048.1 acyl-CoA synthetase [Candidatus Halobonum tyrrellensis G22]